MSRILFGITFYPFKTGSVPGCVQSSPNSSSKHKLREFLSYTQNLLKVLYMHSSRSLFIIPYYKLFFQPRCIMMYLKEVFSYGVSSNHGKGCFFVFSSLAKLSQINILDLKSRMHTDFIKLFDFESICKHCFMI